MIRQRIKSGTYPPKHLVSELSIVQEFGIARDTARKAVRALREEGLLYTIPHLGSFVSPPDDTKAQERQSATD